MAMHEGETGSMRPITGKCHAFRPLLIVGVPILSAALLITQGLTLQGQEPSRELSPAQNAGKPVAGKLDEAKARRDVIKALRKAKLALEKKGKRAVKKVNNAALKAKIPPAPSLPERPARTVTPPSLTPEDVDRMVEKFLTETHPKVDTVLPTNDLEFARRIYLDLAGTLPTPEQLEAFIRDRSNDKRARLIDQLLTTPEYAHNWARYWRDVIRFHATNQNPGQVRYDELERWLAQQFEKNAPWDEIARGLITAEGRVDENGAVGFGLAHEAKPVELAGEISRIFMGVQIQCAQCHDHKTDSWKREQFHEFAAFFSGNRQRNVEKASPGKKAVFAIEKTNKSRYTMPDLEDPAKQIPVAPRFFLASHKNEPPLAMALPAKERRELGAAYVTGQDNPWFARAYVNRIWYALMGETFYDQIDDLGPERNPRARELIETLASQWQQGGYDVRWLFRVITNTKAYQRRIKSTSNLAGKTPFASNCPSQLRSDQIVDSLIQALGLPVEPRPLTTTAAMSDGEGDGAMMANEGQGEMMLAPEGRRFNKKAAAAAGLGSVPGAPKGQAKAVRAGGPRVLFNSLFGVDPSILNDEVLGTIPQALFLMNSPLVNNRTVARPGTVLTEILASTANDREALDALYLRVLSRRPNAQEMETCGSYLAKVGKRKEAFEDIYWALINSTEFISRR